MADLVRTFCDFQHFGPERGFLSPCREFAFVSISSLVIMFFAVISIVQTLTLPQPAEGVVVGVVVVVPGSRLGPLLFAFAAAFSALAILCQMAIPFSPPHPMPFVLLTGYSLAAFVWLAIAVAHFLAVVGKRHLPLLPFVPSAISVVAFVLVSAQRWISFGLHDTRTLLSFFLLILQCTATLLSILPSAGPAIFRWPALFRRGNWRRLEEEEEEETMRVAEQQQQNSSNPASLVYAGRGQSNLVAHIFSELFFCWTNALISKGYRRELNQVEDTFELPASLDLLSLERVLLPSLHGRQNDQNHNNDDSSNSSSPSAFSFAPELLRVYGRPFFLLGALRLVGDLFKFASPVLLHLLISSLEEPTMSLRTGYACSALMFLTMLLSSACDFHFGYRINMLALKAKTALLLAVYEKLVHIPAHRLRGEFSSGKLINLMCTDVDRISGFITSFHAFWSMPMNFAIALFLLYREIGLAFLAGLGASVLLIPLNKYIALKIGQLSNKMMQMKDARMKLVTELTHSMRTVKLNNWEPFFEAKINAIRERELAHLKAIKYLDAVCVYLWASAPIVITVLMLVTFTALLHEQLTAAKVFTTLALINILILPLNAFPWVLSSIINGLVSKRRFDSFFGIKCGTGTSKYTLINEEDVEEQRENNRKVLLELHGSSFGWTDPEEGGQGRPAVSGLHFAGRRGALIGVVGPVGSGKSTLLLGLLAETTHQGPPIRVAAPLLSQGVAYVGQDVWLREGTIRENILCELPFESERFQAAIDCCGLAPDIQVMPGREAYRISGEGITLSGGQKVRLALARAVYADKPIYLLDDPFAALDRTVARFVYEQCIERALRATGKLVILCTHHEQYLANADLVIRLGADGEVEQMGSPREVLPSLMSSSPFCLDKAKDQESEAQTAEEEEESEESESPPMDDDVEFVGPEEVPEEKEQGAVRLGVYQSYVQAIGHWMTALVLLSILAMQCSKNGSDIWLSRWASDAGGNHSAAELAGQQLLAWSFPFSRLPSLQMPTPIIIERADQSPSPNFFLLVYVSIAGLNSLFTLVRAFLFAFGCVLAARRLHAQLLSQLLRASIAWWDRTPCGRVTNRLSSDVGIVDDALPFQLNIFLASMFALVGTLLVTVVALPLLSPLVVLLFPIYFFIQKYYRRTTVELKRITALSLSPLYNHLAETVSGLVPIRALRITDRFSSLMRHRLGQNLRAQFSSLACSQWLSVRIQLLGICIVTAIAFASVLDVSLFRLASPGLIGLAITYALSFTNLLNGLLSAFIETEKELVSVERICDYLDNVPAEEGADEVREAIGQILCRRISGQIRFTGVSLRYGPDLPLAIRDVSFNIEAGRRVAIIGRTGSGKSTVLQALLRAHPIETGKMHIDEHIDLESVGLRSARHLFGFVSQQPFLFTGSLRENLCMANPDVDDIQIRAIIVDAGLGLWLNQFGGLDALIQEGGRNLSFGERQLISLLRLALSRPKIILIDEATAHMDERTHRLMGQLISGMGCTVLAVIHRLAGLAQDYDWVIEMSGGQIARQGPPAEFRIENKK